VIYIISLTSRLGPETLTERFDFWSGTFRHKSADDVEGTSDLIQIFISIAIFIQYLEVSSRIKLSICTA